MARAGRRQIASKAIIAVALSVAWSCPHVDARSGGVCAAPGRITPGVAIGLLRIGMPLAGIISLLGPPSVLDRVPSEDPRQWQALAAAKASRAADISEVSAGWAAAFYDSGANAGLQLYARDSQLARITLDGAEAAARLRDCVTKEGIRLGSSARSLRRAYGPPEFSAVYSWD